MTSPELSAWDHPDSAWNRAVRADHYGDPFCCRTEWQISFHEVFAPHRPLHVVERDGSLLAFAERRHPAGLMVLEPIDCNWLFACPLLGPDAVDLLAEFLARREPQPALISGLVRRGRTLRELRRTFARGYELRRVTQDGNCTASLDGGLDGYLSRRSAKTRRGVRSAQRRAAALGVTFERCAPTAPAACDAVFERILAVERSSWKGIDRCGMAQPPSSTYYRAMLRRLGVSGSARVMFARHDERDIGFIFGGLGSGVYRGQQFSFDDTWRRHSIGNLLQLEQVRWLCEERVARYDMGPPMDYKSHWTERVIAFDAYSLFPTG